VRKKIVVLLLSVVLVTLPLLAGCSSTGPQKSEDAQSIQERTFKIGHIRPDGSSADLNVELFKDEISKASDGKLNIEIYPASQLGDYTVVMERVSIGDIEMQISPLGTNIDKGFGISSAPYIVENWDQAKETFKSGGTLVNVMAEKMEENGIKYLAGYPLYFGGIALMEEPLSPEDPNVAKNLKIRVPPMKSYEQCAVALGYQATPLAFSDTFTALQTGIVEGAIGAGAEGYYSNFKDLIKYYLPVNDHFEMWYLYMNLELWNGLSVKEQEIIQSAASALEEKRFAEAEAETSAFESKMEDAGIKIIRFTDEQLSEFAKVNREKVWPIIKDDFGQELFDQITSSIK